MVDMTGAGADFEIGRDFLEFHFPKGGIPLGWSPMPGRNAFKYTSEEFEPRGALNVLCLGDSCTEADSYSREQIYPGILAGLLKGHFGVPVGNWNLGMGEGGYDFIARTLVCALDALRPDVVILALPTMTRRELYMADGRRLRMDQSTAITVNRGRHTPPPEIMDYYRVWPKLDSHFDDLANAVKNLKIAAHTLNRSGVIWGYGVNGYYDWVELTASLRDKGWFEREHYFGFDFDVVDHVSKGDAHPGLTSHRMFGERLFGWLLQNHEAKLKDSIARAEGASGRAVA